MQSLEFTIKATYSKKSTMENAVVRWQGRLNNSRRMKPEELRELVRASAMEIHGSYSFLNFLNF